MMGQIWATNWTCPVEFAAGKTLDLIVISGDAPTLAPRSTMLSKVSVLACSAISTLVAESRNASNELRHRHMCCTTTSPSLDWPLCRTYRLWVMYDRCAEG